MCVFDGGTISDAEFRSIRLDPEEHDRCLALEWEGWVTEADARRAQLLGSLQRARLMGRTEYLVNGSR
ncbi:hypothetical protein [Streptomyces sp. NPDC053048]|uniref:hypothetical protein n=1 Tax=Streptomyces sp. NPDC053048 TaxID=3365694 RepID=UPI0037D38099